MRIPSQVEALNARDPIGTLVEVSCANGSTNVARTNGPLRVWATSEVVELATGRCLGQN